MSLDNMNNWMDYLGKKFLKDIGMQKEQYVLDFGCGPGNYTIPASSVVGEKGRIYAIDKNKESLIKLTRMSKDKELKNIEIIELLYTHKLPLSKNSIDIVLLYDVLHLVENRKHLLVELHHILKPHGVLSVYPKHHQTHMNMNVDEVKEEIVSFCFHFDKKLYKTLMHDNQLEEGYLLNFKKP
jgi:ubiquinone/menaquinone biosynthesis C-methylase UbiE